MKNVDDKLTKLFIRNEKLLH